ncbi:MAG: hypothetical protein C0448_08895 [Sphingobacteriaceae bacterium]|nr:hypothetical protein [Sphingobacteriaceae bacterium]
MQIFWGFNRFFEKPLFITPYLKYLVLLFLHLTSSRVISQTTFKIELNYSKSDIHVPRVIAKKPLLLVNYLTKNKIGEKEKFDAIFAWVASNIKYNFSAYYASSGAGMPRINQILKYRTGICLDYAYLMDSLCKLANITNVTVLGYAKDELFDVQDSIYSDNHAWNAVKLDNKWFIYDVTWASGETDYKLTKFSQFIYNLYLKHPPKFKTKRSVSKKLFMINYCDSALSKTPVVFTYSKQKFWNKWLHKQLFRFKLKTKRFNNQIINPQYYLCDPDTFFIHHFPDNPTWSLVSKKDRIAFESDSAFYHLNDSTFNHQNRYGRTCPECDDYLSLDELNKNQALRKASLDFNKRNRFITTICEYNIGKIKFFESKSFDDSLSKVTIIDTSLSYLSFANQSLLKSNEYTEAEYVFQKNKNLFKANLLYKENNEHRDFIIADKYNTRTASKSIKDLERLTRMTDAKLIRRIKRIDKYDEDEVPNPKIKNTTFKLLEINQNLRATDSMIFVLNRHINSLKILFEKITINLSNNLKSKIKLHDSTFFPLEESMYLRYLMRDNYKKEIVELRKKINIIKQEYIKHIDSLVYKPSDLCFKIGEELYTTINIRNAYAEQAFKIKAELIRRSQIEPKLLKEYKLFLHSQNREDICWIKNRMPSLKALFFLLEDLSMHQEKAQQTLKKENHIENRRFKYVNKELNRRKHKYRSIILNNTKVVNYQIRIINKEKREFLKKLRKERRDTTRVKK